MACTFVSVVLCFMRDSIYLALTWILTQFFSFLKTKKDEYLGCKLERVPFLEEQVRRLNEGGGILAGDIERLMNSENNQFEFVNEVAAEAKAYVENNRDEYGRKKAILHVLSNRMNDAGFARPEAYMVTDPFLLDPNFEE